MKMFNVLDNTTRERDIPAEQLATFTYYVQGAICEGRIMEKKTAYQAYGNAGKITQATPRQAATAYFAEFPRSRKCNVTEGQIDGHFFVVTYGRKSLGEWPASWRDVTKTTAATLPDQGVRS